MLSFRTHSFGLSLRPRRRPAPRARARAARNLNDVRGVIRGPADVVNLIQTRLRRGGRYTLRWMGLGCSSTGSRKDRGRRPGGGAARRDIDSNRCGGFLRPVRLRCWARGVHYDDRNDGVVDEPRGLAAKSEDGEKTYAK